MSLSHDVQAALPPNFEPESLAWRQMMEDRLRAEDGWLTVVGLHWLSEGSNAIGSDPTCAVPLPAKSTSSHLGWLTLQAGQVTLTVTGDDLVQIDQQPARNALLRDDHAEGGATLVNVGDLTFFVIKRGDQYAIRVRQRSSPARQMFSGRHWFPLDPAYYVLGRYVPHPTPRTVTVMNSVGSLVPMENPGWVTFRLAEHDTRLEAFDAGEDTLWFIFKDATNEALTYKAGRFLYATRDAQGGVLLDFNRAYHPPCAFTPFATCPLPPRENTLPFPIDAGERLPL
ncbi:MAG TPA: DUF1684 domain-containing protein [Aggregatilineales bacterium]|nr:DUF1684 domain-containing protein [Anaerolineales bacterium]HRE46583.1 DUF1684 domain-containing protein [Aggregatilineales bacterium]